MTKTFYKLMLINSADLIIPRDTCQRNLKIGRAKRIALEFNEYIANEPKVSCRGGKYYVFDGQHTIKGRILCNGGKDLPILCKVYFGLSEQEEAYLFAMQHGISAPVSTGYRVRSLAFSGQPEAVAFKEATEELGIALDYDHEKGAMRIGCIKAALKAYQNIGKELYQEALKILIDAWGDDPDALRRENVVAMTRFVDLYRKDYNRHRLTTKLRSIDPLTIRREGERSGTDFAGDKKYLYQVFRLYNGNGYDLKLKF